MTRVIAGTAGGRRLQTPSGSATRPTSDRVREALFSALESALGTLARRSVLDLFAGSGAVGLEALSRGASHAVLVERDRRTATLIRQNARSLGLRDASVVLADAASYVRTTRPDGPYDVLFCDPPYAYPTSRLETLLGELASSSWMARGSMVVVERSVRDAELGWPSRVEAGQRKVYGETALWYGHCHA